MNRNEICLIKYLSSRKYEQSNATHALVNFLINRGIKFTFGDLNPVCNAIDEMEFFDNNLIYEKQTY